MVILWPRSAPALWSLVYSISLFERCSKYCIQNFIYDFNYFLQINVESINKWIDVTFSRILVCVVVWLVYKWVGTKSIHKTITNIKSFYFYIGNGLLECSGQLTAIWAIVCIEIQSSHKYSASAQRHVASTIVPTIVSIMPGVKVHHIDLVLFLLVVYFNNPIFMNIMSKKRPVHAWQVIINQLITGHWKLWKDSHWNYSQTTLTLKRDIFSVRRF